MTATNVRQDNDALRLSGLDGTNPLGFLAALGLFRAVVEDAGQTQARMTWEPYRGTWIPALVDGARHKDTLLDQLDACLKRDITEHPIAIFETMAGTNEVSRRNLFQNATSSRLRGAWLAAVGSDIASAKATSQLQTARRDYFYGNLTAVIARTTRQHLERALFHPWDYADALDNQSLHLDPSEDRRHAHQWNQPAGDPNRKKSGGMLAANRLAVEAFPWFVSLPEGEDLHTLGFKGQRSYNTCWTWPIWTIPLHSEATKSALALTGLQDDKISEPVAQCLHARGVTAAFRTRRILVGKTPNFTPAQRIA
jgi:CRISPR-associated endonuclease/helicase Cas3